MALVTSSYTPDLYETCETKLQVRQANLHILLAQLI